MLKDYFTGLFNYDKHVNQQLAALITTTGDTGKPAELMAHLLTAQQVWLSRCEGLPPTAYQLWPKWEPDVFTEIIIKNHREWINFLNTETDPERIIAYKNTRGDKFNNKVTDILAHVINHGTHHRAQIGTLLKQGFALELPPTDYIFYIRGLQ